MGFRDEDKLTYAPADLDAAVAAVRARSSLAPRLALILGSGLGAYADGFKERVAVDYTDLPGFPVSTVEGHAGRLVLGTVSGVPAVAQQGRFHPYEGYSAAEVTFPLRVMHALGARILIVTNAAGGANPLHEPGDLMLIEDQVNFQFRSPLRGSGPLLDASRFADLSRPFSPRLLAVARRTSATGAFGTVHTGTYWGNLGPAYETRAEIAMIRRLGGDAVGMSTVAEVIVAAQLAMEVLGITCISNPAAGLSPERLGHQEVIDVTAGIRGTFTRFLDSLAPQL